MKSFMQFLPYISISYFWWYVKITKTHKLFLTIKTCWNEIDNQKAQKYRGDVQ